MNAITRRRSLMTVQGGEPPVPPTPVPIYDNYLVFEVISDGTITWRASSASLTKTIEYSKDSGNSWTSITSNTSGVTINVVNGDIICFKGNNGAYGNKSYYNYFGGTASVLVGGTISALLGGNTMQTYAFTYLFYFYKTLDISRLHTLVLPANCSSNCCDRMFSYCTSLTTAPELPAATLAPYCYSRMFQGCTSLTTAPELPATTLVYACYAYMFYNCSSLNYIKCLATTIPVGVGSTTSWVYNVAPSGTFVKDLSMTSWTTDDAGIPYGWTVQNA